MFVVQCSRKCFSTFLTLQNPNVKKYIYNNLCSIGRTTLEKQFIFTTTTPDQDEEEMKKSLQKCTKTKIGRGSEEMQRDGQTD
jgi:hypothetical protein